MTVKLCLALGKGSSMEEIIVVFLLGFFGLIGYYKEKRNLDDESLVKVFEVIRVFSILMIGMSLTFAVAYWANYPLMGK